MITHSIIPKRLQIQRSQVSAGKRWLFSGLIAYGIQGVAWVFFGLGYGMWKEIWGSGLIEGREERIAEGALIASPLGSILGNAMLYAWIGFTIAGLIHMLAYSIPGGIFWALTKRDSILVRQPWISWLIGWTLGTMAMGVFIHAQDDWIGTAAILGGFYGILTAAICCAVGRRLLGKGNSTAAAQATENRISDYHSGVKRAL